MKCKIIKKKKGPIQMDDFNNDCGRGIYSFILRNKTRTEGKMLEESCAAGADQTFRVKQGY